MTTSTNRRTRAQKDVLVRQFGRVRAQIDEGDPWHEVLMLEWYARYQPEAFAHVRDRCASLARSICQRADIESRAWQYHLPLFIATADQHEAIASLPGYATFALNRPDYSRRMRARLAVYLAAPAFRADALHDACLAAVGWDRDPRRMLFITGICAGGLDLVWRVREQMPEHHDWVDDVVNELARGAVVWNPFAHEVAQLMLHMVIENTGMREEAVHWRDDWHIERDEQSLRDDLRKRVEPLMGAHANLSDIERMSRWRQKDEQVRCPLFIGSEWYRLMRASDGRCWVEQRRPGDYWSQTDAVSVAGFIAELRRVKGV